MQRMWVLAALALSAWAEETTTSTPDLSNLYSQDVAQQCVTMKNCQLPGHLLNRGFCVSKEPTKADYTGKGQYCWDVCNPNHETTEYTVNGNGEGDLANHVSQALVAQVRAGINNNITCPKELNLHVPGFECPAGEECPKDVRHKYKVANGQGLCVVEGDSETGQACFDMCDFRIPPSRFSEGAHQGIALKVMDFRNSGACARKPWLPWVIVGVCLLLCCLCTGLAIQGYRRRSGRRAELKETDDSFDQEGDADREMSREEMPPFEDMPGYGQQEDTEYGAPPARASASYEGGPPMQMQQMQQMPQMQHYPDMPDQLGSTGASMKIPGLDEPHLPMPWEGHAPPSPQPTRASNALTSTGQYQMQMPLLQSPGSPSAAYTTQMPQGFQVASPTAGSRVFTTTLPTYGGSAPQPMAGGSMRLASPAVTATVRPATSLPMEPGVMSQPYTTYSMPHS